MLKIEFIVYNKSKIFETAHLLNCLAVDGDGVQSSVGCVLCANDQFFCFVHIEQQVVVSAPL